MSLKIFTPAQPQREISWDEAHVQRARIIARFKWQFPNKQDWSYSFEPGWLTLIERVCERVDALVPHEAREHFGWQQIKEKFASIRMYFRGGPFYADIHMREGGIRTVTAPNEEAHLLGLRVAARIQRTVRAAGDISSRTCQKCGARGTLRRVNGYYITLCPGHQNGSTEPRRQGQ